MKLKEAVQILAKLTGRFSQFDNEVELTLTYEEMRAIELALHNIATLSEADQSL